MIQPTRWQYVNGWTVFEYARGACPCGIKAAWVCGLWFDVKAAQEAAFSGGAHYMIQKWEDAA